MAPMKALVWGLGPRDAMQPGMFVVVGGNHPCEENIGNYKGHTEICHFWNFEVY